MAGKKPAKNKSCDRRKLIYKYIKVVIEWN
jgi:hypothetical protein